MSLILDALKKLEREKQTTPRGFLVVAPGAWVGRGRGASLVAASLAVGLVLGALGLAAYGRITRAAATPPASTQPLPTLAQATMPPQPLASPRPTRLRSAGTPLNPARNVPAETSDPGVAAPPASPAPEVHEGPRLQAISERDGHPVAVIDEKMVREGDEVDGMKILRIGAAEVEIEHLGRRRILRF